MEGEILFKFLLCIVPLLALWGFSSWLVKDKAPFAWPGKNLFLQRVEFLNLGQSHSLHLVKFGEDKALLLSISPKGTDLLLSANLAELKPLSEPKSNQGHPAGSIQKFFQKGGEK